MCEKRVRARVVEYWGQSAGDCAIEMQGNSINIYPVEARKLGAKVGDEGYLRQEGGER